MVPSPMTPDDGVLNVEYILTNFCVYGVLTAVVAPPCSVIVTQTRVFDSLDVVPVSVAVSSVVSSVSTVSGVVAAAAAVVVAAAAAASVSVVADVVVAAAAAAAAVVVSVSTTAAFAVWALAINSAQACTRQPNLIVSYFQVSNSLERKECEN